MRFSVIFGYSTAFKHFFQKTNIIILSHLHISKSLGGFGTRPYISRVASHQLINKSQGRLLIVSVNDNYSSVSRLGTVKKKVVPVASSEVKLTVPFRYFSVKSLIE